MELRAGDKLLCKKNYNDIDFPKLRYYNEDDYIKKNILHKDNVYIIEQCYEDIYLRINGHLFVIVKNVNTPYIWNYFYTSEELRNLKLNSL